MKRHLLLTASAAFLVLLLPEPGPGQEAPRYAAPARTVLPPPGVETVRQIRTILNLADDVRPGFVYAIELKNVDANHAGLVLRSVLVTLTILGDDRDTWVAVDRATNTIGFTAPRQGQYEQIRRILDLLDGRWLRSGG